MATTKPLTRAEFDLAASHPYACKCDLCERFWKGLPPEEDSPYNPADSAIGGEDEPTF